MASPLHLTTGRRERLFPPLLAGLLALALYAYTAAPSLTWAHHGQDGGDLIAAAMTWGVPHPSGYPTYCLLGRLFALLPLGDVARRFNLFSALAAAGAVALACVISEQVLRCTTRLEAQARRRLSFAAALCLAASPMVWSQAVIAEVYALNVLSCALCLYLAMRLTADSPPASWGALGLALGLGLGNHLTLLWLAPAIALWIWPRANKRRVIAALGGLGLGLTVYLYIPLAAAGDPPVNWGQANTPQGLWWLLTGRLYHGYLWRLPLGHVPSRLLAWIGLWGRQFTPFGLALVTVGFASWLQRRGAARRLALALLASIGLWSAHALGYDTSDSYLYLLPAFLLATPALAAGALTVLGAIWPRPGRLKRLLTPGLLCALALWSAWQQGPALSLRHDAEAVRWLTATLTDLPPRSLVITGEDGHTFALSYALWVEGQRPDLALVDGELWAQPWYAQQVQRRYPDLRAEVGLSLEELVAANLTRRPICFTNPRPNVTARLVIRQTGDLICLEGRPPQ